MRFVLDYSATITGDRILGGSPPSILRVSPAGRQVIDNLLDGDEVERGQLVERLLHLGIIHPVIEPRPLHDDHGKPVVTVVTPTLGEPAHRSLHGLDADHVVIVDDGSSPPVAGARIRLSINLGPGAARNRGLELVDTEFCAFVDADVDAGIDGAWIGSLLGHFDDPDVVAVAPRVRSRSGTGRLERYEHVHGALDMGDNPGPVRPGTRLGYLPAAAVICRTDALRNIGGFDESLRTGEDVDLIWRLIAAGGVVRYAPEVEVIHEPRQTWRAWVRQRIGYGASTAPLERRHPGRLAPVVASPWSTAAIAAVLLPRRWWLGLVTSAGILAIAGEKLSTRLSDLGRRESHRIVFTGTSRTAGALTRAVRRTWWPLVVALLWFRPIRRLAVFSVLAARSPIALADDLSHGVGVWNGMLNERSVRALQPQITDGRPDRPITSTYHSSP